MLKETVKPKRKTHAGHCTESHRRHAHKVERSFILHKKGCKLEFPFTYGGNKKWFYKVHVWNILTPGGGKKTAVSDKKDLKLSAKWKYETIKKENVGPSFLKPLTNSFKYIFDVTFIFQHNIYLQL